MAFTIPNTFASQSGPIPLAQLDANFAALAGRNTQGGVSVKDFGAKGDGTADDTAALQSAIDWAVSQNSDRPRTLYFPQGIYIIKNTLLLRGSTNSSYVQVIGCRFIGDGNGSSGTASHGTIIKYHPSGGYEEDRPMLLASHGAFIGNTIEGITFDASGVAFSCVKLAAYEMSANPNKHWTFRNVSFTNAAVASVVIGAYKYEPDPKKRLDSDAHLNVFDHCQFSGASSTLYHVFINGGANTYQTTLRDCSNEGKNENLINFVCIYSGNQTVINNCFGGGRYVQSYKGVAILRTHDGSIDVFGLKSEDPRILYRVASGNANSQVAMYSVTVNNSDSASSPPVGMPWHPNREISVDDNSSAPLTLVDCKFCTEESAPRTVKTNSISLTAVGTHIGRGGIAPFQWTEALLQTGWQDIKSPHCRPQYRVQANGILELRGVASGGAAGSVIFTLPAAILVEYRQFLFAYSNSGNGYVLLEEDAENSTPVHPKWDFKWMGTSAAVNLSLDGLRFSLRTT